MCQKQVSAYTIFLVRLLANTNQPNLSADKMGLFLLKKKSIYTFIHVSLEWTSSEIPMNHIKRFCSHFSLGASFDCKGIVLLYLELYLNVLLE